MSPDVDAVRDIDGIVYIGYVVELNELTARVFVIASRRKNGIEREMKSKPNTLKLRWCEKSSFILRGHNTNYVLWSV